MTDSITTDQALKQSLQGADSESTRELLNDTDAYGYALSMIEGTLQLASGKPSDIVFGMTSKATSTVDLSAKATGSGNLQLANTSLQILIQSASLISLAGKTNPAVIFATVGAATAKKTALALGLASDNKQAKCLAAFADLTASTLGAGVATGAAVASGGLAVALAIGAVSQVILSAYNAHKACTAE